MKSWLVLSFIFTIANALDQEFIDEFMEKLQDFGGECAEETHATSDDIAELIARKIPPSTHEGKCMIFCMQKKFRLMKDNGTLDKSGAMIALQPLKKVDPVLYEKLLKVFVTCGLRAKILEDPCETATNLAACGQVEAEAMGLEDSLLT